MKKKCTHCRKVKSLSEFGADKSTNDGLRYDCKSCRKESYDRRRPRLLESSRRRYEAKREAILEGLRLKKEERLAKARDYYRRRTQSDPKYLERLNEKARRWQRQNPIKNAASAHRWRTRIRGNGGSYTEAEWLALCERFGNVCLACLKPAKLTVDHIVPVSKGGANSIDNIQPLCRPCNSRKRDRAIDYRGGEPRTLQI